MDETSPPEVLMNRFPYGKTFLLGLGFFGISMIWPIFNSLIPPMLEDLGLTAAMIGFILTWDNIINMFLQPYVGSLSDRTQTRFGRRKPFLLIGAPLAAIFFILVPYVRSMVVPLALAILVTDLAMALFRSPTISYLGDLFQPQERSKANGVINLMGGLAGAVALFAGGALYKIGVPLPFIVASAVMLVSIAVVVAVIRENGAAAGEVGEGRRMGLGDNLRRLASGTDKSGVYLLAAIFSWFVGWNAMEAFFTLYARNVLEVDIGSGTQMLTAFAATLILFSIPSGLIATRFGRKPTILVGLAGMLAGLLVGFVIRQPTFLLVVLAVMGGFWALININSLPMVYDLGDRSSIGALTGLYYFSSSAAAITGPILAGGLIDLTGHSAVWIFSAVFIALAGFFMLRVRPVSAIPEV
jgi:Na+/melibiose symporter-like transporter